MLPINRFISILLACFIAQSAISQTSVFAGSTSCFPAVNARLKISPADTCAFMKWELRMTSDKGKPHSFTLLVSYGDFLPNTTNFLNGGKSVSFRGKMITSYVIKNNTRYKLYHLTREDNKQDFLSFIEMDANVLHLADNNGRLIKGDDCFFAFALNRLDAPPCNCRPSTFVPSLPAPADHGSILGIFDGRTPCQELAKLLNVPTIPECIKIKWRLILYKNGQDTTTGAYALEGFKFRGNNILKGQWKMIKGSGSDMNAIVYELALSSRGPLYFLRADGNVLFFLDRDKNIIVGNRNFTYALYRAPY